MAKSCEGYTITQPFTSALLAYISGTHISAVVMGPVTFWTCWPRKKVLSNITAFLLTYLVGNRPLQLSRHLTETTVHAGLAG